MIKARERESLTADAVLKRVSEYEIYRRYLGKDFQLGTVISSPFRKDKNPSLLMGNRGGFIHHKDLADERFKGNCFQFVQQLHGVTFNEALQMINRDLNIGLQGLVAEDYKPLLGESKPIEENRSPLIQVVSRPFDATELAWWGRFHLDVKDLKEDNVFAIKKLYFNRQQWHIKKTELVFGYLYDDKWKIYWPEREKGDKWGPNNVSNDRMDGLENLKGADVGIITKSKKDKMVSRKFLIKASASTQNESSGAISSENIKYIQENVKRPYVIFDNDKTGVESCMHYNQYGFGYWNVPQKYRKDNVKDLAELVELLGPEGLREEVGKKIEL